MDSCELRDIDRMYNSEMLSIMKASPINANGLSLYFDKSPDIFKIPAMKFSLSEHVGFFIGDKLEGFGSLGYFNAFVQGNMENVFSLYNFYLLPEARGRKISGTAVEEFFKRVRGESANYGISITLKGNKPGESYVHWQFSHIVPPRRIIDELIVKTILFSRKIKNHSDYRVRTAVAEDIPAIVKLLCHEHQQRDFGIPYSADLFLSRLNERGLQVEDYYVATDRRGAIKGVCLAWDCTSFRRSTVLRYSPRFYPTLVAYKTLEKMLPLKPFPKKGESFKELTITDYAVADRDPLVMHALLSEIYFRHNNRRYHFMNWGSCASDPMLIAAKGFWYRNVESHIMFTSMDTERLHLKPRLPYIDIAFV